MHSLVVFILMSVMAFLANPSVLAAATESAEVSSPDSRVVVQLTVSDEGNASYSVKVEGVPVILDSPVGLRPGFDRSVVMRRVDHTQHKSEWLNPFGELSRVPDHFSQMKCTLENAEGKQLVVVLRAYNEGIALRYESIDDSAGCDYNQEVTGFCFPEQTVGYEEHGTEGPYRLAPLGEMKPGCQWPLTLRLPNETYAAICEAANSGFPRMLLSPLPGRANGLVTSLGDEKQGFKFRPGDKSPWRVLLLGKTPGELLQRNYLLLCLNPPCRLNDTDWIKPGKVMRDMGLSTQSAKSIVDFAATAGLRYVHLDAGWYGSEDAQSGDATQPRTPGLNIRELVQYAKSHGVGLTVYVDRRQIKSQRDELFKLYSSWGIAGVKIGFIDVGTQANQEFITETIAKAAEHHLMLDIHDNYRASGLNRTFPNLMTVEGIRGNEHMPTAEHNCTLPFTRYLSGAGDYTVCYYMDRKKTTHAHQLAMSVVSFSPLQWLLWYDSPSRHNGEPEMEFFREVPTVWDETRVLEGEIGSFATIARRSGKSWFVGSINNSARELKLPLGFLNDGAEYLASIYYDDPAVETRTRVGIRSEPVTNSDTLQITSLNSGGAAVWIRPLESVEKALAGH